MKVHRDRCFFIFVAYFCLFPLDLKCFAAPYWSPPSLDSVKVIEDGKGSCQIIDHSRKPYTIDSTQSYPAKDGDVFEFKIRIKVGLYTIALPELVCFDAKGKEIPVPSSLEKENKRVTTNWQSLIRQIPVQPGTKQVRARIRAEGLNDIYLADWELRPCKVDPYVTGALIDPPHPILRTGVLLDMNHGILNPELLGKEDRDGDGKWAMVNVDLDQMTELDQKGEDWRTKFEDNSNDVLWSFGSVLKSDSVKEDRKPDTQKALHFKMKVHEGPYKVFISDPGRAVAYSADGQTWKRFEGGSEIKLGEQEMKDGVIEFWLDACYRDRISIGPVYADYVRLLPTMNTPSVDRLFHAALKAKKESSHGSAEKNRVEIQVNGSLFTGGDHWPVRCGLPIPQGELNSAEHVAVLDPSGTPIPTQNRVMATWPDGSVKWIFLDFEHNFSKDAEKTYTVVYGNQVTMTPVQKGIQVQSDADGIKVNTGAIQFLVSKKRFGILEKVQLTSGQMVQDDPMSIEIVEAGGKTWKALDLPVEKAVVEQSGPLHTVIMVETRMAESGKPSEGFYHRVRIHAYANSPLVQVDYFVANTDSRPAKVEGSMSSKVMVKSISLKLKPHSTVAQTLTQNGTSVKGFLIQKTGEDMFVNTGGTSKELKGRQQGWISAGLADGSFVGAGMEAFREQYPKAIRWNPEGLELGLWAPEGGDYEWIEGVGKTHHLSFYYGLLKPSRAEILSQGPVLAVAKGDWYARSGAFGPQVMARESGFPVVEKTLADHIDTTVVENVGLGFENYGDHSSHGYVVGSALWDNNEYDLPAGCMVHFVRTGNPGALRVGLASALHYLDVDTIHYSSKNADWARAQHVHSHAVFGGHTAGGPDFHHAGYVQGLIWYSYFTGEPIGVTGAQGIADWINRNLRILTTSMERAVGHPMMTLNDVYEATWDPVYLKGSAQLVDQSLKWEHPERSGFLAPITESPAFYSGCPFNCGLITSALMKFNSWAQLPEIDQMLERNAQWVLTDVWRPDGLQSKGGSSRRTGEKAGISSHCRLMALEYQRTQDPFYLAVPWDLIVDGYGEQAVRIVTRKTGLVFNYLPWLLKTYHDLGNPEPEAALSVKFNAPDVDVVRGETATVSVTLQNKGTEEIQNLNCSFHIRLDLKTHSEAPAPVSLAPGKSITLLYKVQTPARLNVSIECDRIAYGHFSCTYQRNHKMHLAHQYMKLTMKE